MLQRDLRVLYIMVTFLPMLVCLFWGCLLWLFSLLLLLFLECLQEKKKKKENDAGMSAAAAAKSLQSCPTLCNPTDGSPSGSPVPGILQARTLEWVAISFSNAWKWKVKVQLLSRVWLLATPRTAAYQAPPMRFSRQEYWSGLPLPSRKVHFFKIFLIWTIFWNL